MPDSHRALAGLATLSIAISVGACLYTASVGTRFASPTRPRRAAG